MKRGSRVVLLAKTVLSFGLLSSLAFGGRPPSGGEKVEFEKSFLEWRVHGRASQSVSNLVVKVSNASFKQALQVKIVDRTEQEYDLQLTGKITGQIKKDDVLLLSFYARCEESSDESALGRFTIMGKAHQPNRYLHPFTKTSTIGKKWKHFQIPFIAPLDNETGYSITFVLGGTKPQTLQIGGLELLNYRDKKTMEQLPVTETCYPGMEPGAPWRKAADERIEQHRKEELKITVVDRQGRPVKGAKVRVELKNHAFGFGVAIGLNTMFSARKSDDAKQYQDAVEDLFNKVVFENRMKWKFFKENDAQLEEAIDWCAERNLPLRGHCMVWADWPRLPRGMEEEWGTRTNEFRGVIEKQIQKMATVYPETFTEWDIVNELYTVNKFVDFYGKDVVVDWFRIAKESNPDFICYINDYAILAGYNEKHQNNYYEWIKYLLEQGAPVEGIGLQGHFRAPVPPEEILRRLDRFAEFGLEMQITEFDFEETDELLQARFTRDFMIAVFSHPQTVGIMIWCLWENSAWKPDAAFYTRDWKKKRMAKAWEYMIKEKWHTDQTRTTDSAGNAMIRGFLGDYEIRVTTPCGRKNKVVFTLEKRAPPVKIQL